MAGPRKVILSEQQYAELRYIRDHHPLPYMRERAAGILKVADGQSMNYVATYGLLRKIQYETISDWITRYEQEGIEGLRMKSGRGRKPSFPSPKRKNRRTSARGTKHSASSSGTL